MGLFQYILEECAKMPIDTTDPKYIRNMDFSRRYFEKYGDLRNAKFDPTKGPTTEYKIQCESDRLKKIAEDLENTFNLVLDAQNVLRDQLSEVSGIMDAQNRQMRDLCPKLYNSQIKLIKYEGACMKQIGLAWAYINNTMQEMRDKLDNMRNIFDEIDTDLKKDKIFKKEPKAQRCNYAHNIFQYSTPPGNDAYNTPNVPLRVTCVRSNRVYTRDTSESIINKLGNLMFDHTITFHDLLRMMVDDNILTEHNATIPVFSCIKALMDGYTVCEAVSRNGGQEIKPDLRKIYNYFLKKYSNDKK